MAGPMTQLASTLGYNPAKGLISTWDAAGTPEIVIVYKIFSWLFHF